MDYEKPTVRPAIGKFYGFDHVTFWVGNAKQAASYYTTRLGFEFFAYQGLETGNRQYCTHVISNGDVRFAFKSCLNPSGHDEFNAHLAKHGDGVKDVAFTVDDATGIYQKAVERGAKGIMEPTKFEDDDGYVIMSTVQTYGDTTHTFVQRDKFEGKFLPDFNEHPKKEVYNQLIEPPKL